MQKLSETAAFVRLMEISRRQIAPAQNRHQASDSELDRPLVAGKDPQVCVCNCSAGAAKQKDEGDKISAHGSGSLVEVCQRAFPGIHLSEEVQQRLNRLDARVLARAVDKLADEAQRDPGFLGDGIEAIGPDLLKPAIEIVLNGLRSSHA